MDEQELRKVAEPILHDEELFLVDIIIKGNTASQKVLLLVDGDEGISIDQCGKVSRKLGNLIEEKELIDTRYTLEVSSPGLDFPLKMIRQYHKNIGRELIIELNDGEVVEGKLLDTGQEKILIEIKEKKREYPFEKIKHSKVKISFK